MTLSPMEAAAGLVPAFRLLEKTPATRLRGTLPSLGSLPRRSTEIATGVATGIAKGIATGIARGIANQTRNQNEASVLRNLNDPAWSTSQSAAASPVAFPIDPARAAEQERLRVLVGHCLSGDPAAWQQLVTNQHRRIYGICYRFTGSPSDAEDLTQEAFLKLYRALGSFDPAKGGFQTWITTLTRNLLVDHFRRTRQDRATDSLDVTVSGEEDGPTRAEQLPDTRRTQHDQIAQLQLRAHIQHALQQVSPELREAVILRDLQEMDYKEIAAVLRVPEGTVKSRISRGRGELARILQRDGTHGGTEGRAS